MPSLPQTVEAITIPQTGGIEVLQKTTRPFPRQKPDEFLIKVEGGLYPLKEFPAGIGKETAGTVVALPTEQAVLNHPIFQKQGFKVGGKVAADFNGSHATYISVPWKHVFAVPDGVSTKVAAAALLQGLTVASFTEEAYKVKKGDTILVHTVAGGLGLLFTQFIKAAGATVIGTTSTSEKADLAKAHGVDHVILYKSEDTVKRVLEITNGQGVDAIFDGVGKDTFDADFEMIKRKGTIVAVGNASGAIPPFSIFKLVPKNVRLLRPTLYGYIAEPEEADYYGNKLFKLVESGDLKINIFKEYPFSTEGVQDAQRDLTTGKTTGKVIIAINPPKPPLFVLVVPIVLSDNLTGLSSEMESSDPPKARPSRPLPTPGAIASPRPTTPVQRPAQRAIETSTFYGTPSTSSSAKAAPPLPSRSKPSNLGNYVTQAAEHPYDYNAYREPELIEDTQMEDVPPLISADGDGWGTGSNNNGWEGTGWNTNWANGGSSSTFDMDFLSTPKQDVPIDGRNDKEEMSWWNPQEREKWKRPGAGMLAPLLADELHNPHHSLFSVHISGTPPPPPSNPPVTARPDQSGSFASTPPQPPHSALPISTASSSTTEYPPYYPTDEEIRSALPHPNAYFCPKEHGWVILSWKNSTVPPPFAASYTPPPHCHIPDQTRRRRVTNCLTDDSPYGPRNKTHHFHRYEKAIDSHKLTPPYMEDPWVAQEALKNRRRGRTIVNNMGKLRADEEEESGNESSGDSEGMLMDLYMCCQCGLYCTVSPLIPGVIQRKYLDELYRDKKQNPTLGKSGEVTVSVAIETFLVAIENKMFKGNNRLIKIKSSGFQQKLGYSVTVKKIFENLGFKESTQNGTQDQTLMSPGTDPTEASGPQSRAKLLRAWVELGAWLQDYRKANPTAFRGHNTQQLYIAIDNAREMYQTGVGAHPDQIARGELQDPALGQVRELHDEWRGLGLTPTTFSADLLTFAYLSQCRCDPAGTSRYFTYLSSIANTLTSTGSCPPQIQELIVMEQSRSRFTVYEVEQAARALGFGHDGDLRLEYDEDIDDDFVENAWKDLIKRAWRDPDTCAETQRRANEALKLLAEARESLRLMNVWETEKNKMNPDQAYNTLEIPKETDDEMLITVFNMRLEESTAQIDKMREALTVIAETRDSERLRQFLSTGQDPGEIIVPTRPDLPRGLNQLGNTCYLNSLLQYFYTIKELRDAVTPLANLDHKALEGDKLSDEDLNKHRVGGRHVTRREIVRSRKFVNQLANLFSDLRFSENPAVTPSIDLAKLALVTSRDEEEDEAVTGGSDSSNDTDATLVDDDFGSVPASEPTPSHASSTSSNSVLGKRGRELDKQKATSVMDVDDGYVLVSSPRREGSPQPIEMDRSSPMKGLADRDGDVAMKGATPAPERPPPPKPRPETVDYSGGMMFGKQHDVAECMDNCMFQIETALLKFDKVDEGQLERNSVVKRLFYGKMKQRLTGVAHTSRSSIHEKEDLFSHLPVNVGNDGFDIYDGLSGYFDDVVDWEGGKARMEVTLVDCPPLLQIQLQRVQFNRETLQPYKSQAYVKFGETIYLDRFMENADPRKKVQSRHLQRQLNDCQDRIRMLLEGKNGSFGSALEHTSNFLVTVRESALPGIEDGIIQNLMDEKKRIQREIDELRDITDRLKDELEDLWRDSKNHPYELTSVFIHRGSSPSFGHYFFYSRHLPNEPDQWFKYNDSDVTVVPKEEVLQDTTGSTANPYLLVFARKGANVVKTVDRFVLDDA